MTDHVPRPNHVDFSGGTFHGKVVGKEEHHHNPRTGHRVGSPHGLPSAPAGFTGRRREVDELLRRLAPRTVWEDSNQSNAVVVSALSGMGGIGKTALALHTAGVARGRGWFCAELFVNLHGFTRGTEPLEATAALDTLLRQIGVDPDDIPNDQDARAVLYRSALQALSQEDPEGRPVLVFADNAHCLAQIDPLLPGPGEHRLLVTSREQLTVEGHQPMSLGLLTGEEAMGVLTSKLGKDDPRSLDQAGTGHLVERCGFLPLALKIASALLARSPHLEPGQLAQRLSRSSAFKDSSDHLPTVFAASLEHLSADRVEAFMLLGSNPGPDISTAAAGVLTGFAPDQAEEILEDLAAAHMLTAHPNGRWSMHDLLVDYSHTLNLSSETPSLREKKVKHLLGIYAHTALEADRILFKDPTGRILSPFTSRQSALKWLDAERKNLIASAYTSRSLELTSTSFLLAFSLEAYLRSRRRFSEATDVVMTGREAARDANRNDRELWALKKLGVISLSARKFEEARYYYTRALNTSKAANDAHSEATSWNGLGFALRELECFNEAISSLNKSYELHCKLGDTQGMAMAAGNRGATLYQTQRNEEAITALGFAFNIFHQIGDQENKALCSVNLGGALRQSGRIKESIQFLHLALAIHSSTNNIDGEAQTAFNIGTSLAEMGNYSEAISYYKRACDLFSEIGDMYWEAASWSNLGLSFSSSKNFEEAAASLTYARNLNQDIGDPEGLAHVTRNLGDALQDSRRLDEAIIELQNARDLHQRNADTKCEGGALYSLGTTFVLAERYDDAVATLTQAISTLRKIGDEAGEAGAWNNLFHALSSAGREKEAQYAREQAIYMHQHIETPLALRIVEHLSTPKRSSILEYWNRIISHFR